jgi:hypothetical protein
VCGQTSRRRTEPPARLPSAYRLEYRGRVNGSTYARATATSGSLNLARGELRPTETVGLGTPGDAYVEKIALGRSLTIAML